MIAIGTELSKNQRTIEDVFLKIAESIDAFEQYHRPHAARVAALADETARLFHLGPEDRFSLRIAALAHDFGELTMKRDYINRTEQLGSEDRLDLARHPILGEQEAAQAGADRGSQLLVRWHHEWWNGGGYPDSLYGEQIPLAARILRIADSYASLTEARPFRSAHTEAEARQVVAAAAGLEFDPRVVRAFLSLASINSRISPDEGRNA